MPKTYLVLSSLSFLFAYPASSNAQVFRPFTNVLNVCPDCADNRFDDIELKSGERIKAWILVDDNPAMIVLERHGELRAVARDAVKELRLNANRSDEERRALRLAHPDQILLDDGSVYAGTIVDERKDIGLFKLRSRDVEHMLYVVRIAKIFRGGREIALR